MAKGDDIEARLIDFAVSIVMLCAKLPSSSVGQHLSHQLVRSGTSPAAHYAEARGAESRKDFIHKLKICSKELNESRVWLKIIAKTQMLTKDIWESILEENEQLCRIINASIRTSKEG